MVFDRKFIHAQRQQGAIINIPEPKFVLFLPQKKTVGVSKIYIFFTVLQVMSKGSKLIINLMEKTFASVW